MTEKVDPKTPTTVGIYISGEDDADLSKEDYKKSATVAKYDRVIAEILDIVRTGKVAGQSKVSSDAVARAKKITDFQAKIAKIVPEQEALTDFTVSGLWHNS